LGYSFVKQDRNTVIAYLVLVGLIVVTSLLSDIFLTSRNIQNLLRQVVPLGLVSVGQTFAILTAGIDLSIGSVVSMASCLTSGMILGRDLMILPVIALVIALALFIGFCNGFVITRTRVHPLIVTLGMMSVVQGGLLLYTKSPVGSVPPAFDFLAWGKVWFVPFPIFLFAAIAAAGIFILRRTTFGRYVYATGGNEEVARLSGIKTERIKIVTYMICSLTAAMTGIFLASRMGMGDPLVGERYMLDSILPVLIGGTSLSGGKGGIGATIAGVFIFAILSNALNLLDVSAYWQWMIKGLIIIVAVAFYTTKSR
jgi:ribose/xylose/arabinose/galactoside ABC-type transport system permease subunit